MRDPKQPYEINVPDDIIDVHRHYDDFVLRTVHGDFLISLDFVLQLLKRSRGQLTGQLQRTRKRIISIE
jgi:hypothetical protein